MSALHSLARKHRIEPEQLGSRWQQLAEEHQRLSAESEGGENSSAALQAAEKAYRQAAENLSQARHKAAQNMAAQTLEWIRQLGMEKAQFSVHINQSAISTPTIRIDDAVQADFTQYNVLQGLLLTIRNDFRINPALTFEYTEYRLFQRSSAAFEFAMKASLPLGAKITFIDFYASIELFLKFTLMAIDFLTKDVVPMIDGIAIKTSQQSGF